MITTLRASRARQYHLLHCTVTPHSRDSTRLFSQNARCRCGTPVDAGARYNEINVQQLPKHIHSQIFKSEPKPPPSELVDLAKDHLKRHDLLGKTSDTTPPISFDLPPLQGETLDEHFYRLGMEASEPYLGYAKRFAEEDVPSRPESWVQRSGWTKYTVDSIGKVLNTEEVESPGNETMLVFDVEVLYKISPFAVMACAASSTAWYAWLSPWLLGETENDRQLIPLGDKNVERVVIGHNVGYDRARIKEEYGIAATKNAFLDTMSLHVAVNGMCSRQRPTWIKHAKNRELRERVARETDSNELANLLRQASFIDDEEELWIGRSSINSLRDVAKFHCGVVVDKEIREQFGELDREGVVGKLEDLLMYCAADVAVSHTVYKKILPRFLEVCPHPVSFAALRHLLSVSLPVNRSWEKYIKSAEEKYKELSQGVSSRLQRLALEAVDLKNTPEKFENDDWLKQLDWTIQPIRYVKKTGLLARNQKMPGMPKWYKDLFPRASGPISLTVRSRLSSLLLRLSWDGHPLIWSDLHGWTFKVKSEVAEKYTESAVVKVSMLEEKNLALRDDTLHIYFKLPHKDGPQARCASPLAKAYLQHFESGILTSEYELAKEALEMNAACSYWISARERIKSQMVVYESDLGAKDKSDPSEIGFILPKLIPMGTITRRAVENTWLTASNAKKNRVGSELKAMIRAPPGHVFVGADVDSEELWIASLVGDAQFKLHGGNAIGFMTLEGSKAAGTDLHSRTADILKISRNNAKVFNYGRIYGAGLKFASTLLRQFNPSLNDTQASKIAQELYLKTKGQKTNRRMLSPRQFWRGGTESLVFNKLEEFADQDCPRTPVLGAGITEALMRRYINRGAFMTSRINWAIQSSGVDYLHLLIISMDYLIRRYGLNARLMLTVHDEIRYLVKEDDAYRVAMALQVSNLWTRAMFSQQMGIDDVPQSCAWFSAVDIDRVLRKEVDMDCVTPSQPEPIEPGQSVDIEDLVEMLDKGDSKLDEAKAQEINLNKWEYTPRTPVMKELGEPTILSLKAQLVQTEEELKVLVNEARAEMRTKIVGRKLAERGARKKMGAKGEAWDEEALELDEDMVRRYSLLGWPSGEGAMVTPQLKLETANPRPQGARRLLSRL